MNDCYSPIIEKETAQPVLFSIDGFPFKHIQLLNNNFFLLEQHVRMHGPLLF